MGVAQYGSRFAAALTYAAELHHGQVRKASGVPYITHLLAVAALVGEEGADEETVIAALLHDAAEDHGGRARLGDIAARFGSRVAALVEECSDILPEGGVKPPWEERKRSYIDRAGEKSREAQLISLADKLHNARATLRDLTLRGPESWGAFRGGRDGMIWYWHELGNIYAFSGVSPTLSAEFDRVLEAILER